MTRQDTARRLQVFLLATFKSEEKPIIDQKATFNLTYGVFVLTANHEKDNGCIINTATQVASDPVRLMISVQKGNYTRELIEKSGKFNISVLNENVPFETIRHFGMQSGRDTDKFSSFDKVKTARNGIKYICADTNAFFSLDVVFTKDLGSHVVFIGEVTEAQVLGKEPSCTYAHYHKAIKPKF